MNKKAHLVLRILAVITGLEGLGGIVFLGFEVLTSYVMSRTLGTGDGHLPNVFFYYISVNVLFVLMLTVSASLLWKLRRAGIAWLCATVGCEIVYFFAPVPKLAASSDSALQAGAFLGVGNVAMGLQLVTAFPLIAFMLITLFFRYLRSDDPYSPERKLSPAIMVLFRTLAVTTWAEVLYGIYNFGKLVHYFPGWRQYFAVRYPHFPSFFVAMVAVNIMLAGLLLAAAISLWRLRRKSLNVISWLLGVEILYLVLALIRSVRLGADLGGQALTWFSFAANPLMGMPMIWSQARTYYLLVAPGIVVAAYITRGLSGRTFNASTSIPAPAPK